MAFPGDGRAMKSVVVGRGSWVVAPERLLQGARLRWGKTGGGRSVRDRLGPAGPSLCPSGSSGSLGRTGGSRNRLAAGHRPGFFRRLTRNRRALMSQRPRVATARHPAEVRPPHLRLLFCKSGPSFRLLCLPSRVRSPNPRRVPDGEGPVLKHAPGRAGPWHRRTTSELAHSVLRRLPPAFPGFLRQPNRCPNGDASRMAAFLATGECWCPRQQRNTARIRHSAHA